LSRPAESGPVSCPILLLGAPASHQGKTTVTAALALYHRNQGRRVRVFKTGPDFLDPQILEQAAGSPVRPLDLWMVGRQRCAALLAQAAAEADIILIEGVMGLFDGEPCSADLAEAFGLPIALVIDAIAMAQSFAAIATGLARFRPGLNIAGVLANRIASERHLVTVTRLWPDGLNFYGALFRDAESILPTRHLGLVQAAEVPDLMARLQRLGDAVANTGLAALPPTVSLAAVRPEPIAALLSGKTIAIARDAAFSFIYPDNLELLQAAGAALRLFSPLAGEPLPAADAVWLPGGYPELHLQALSANTRLPQQLREHQQAGGVIYAECGGLLYLLERLTDKHGDSAELAGLLPGHGRMTPRLAALGLQSAALPQGVLRGHTFHHSVLETGLTAALYGRREDNGERGEALYQQGNITASYLHLYFPSCPAAAAALFLPTP
jgi:cobyrinic acid a,c-diamide synthase